MKSAIEHHLETVTIENFSECRNDTFSCYASCTIKDGFLQLGVDGNGNVEVRLNNKRVSTTLSMLHNLIQYKEMAKKR